MQGMNVHGPETAYLFQCRSDAALFAVSLHEEAGNIPTSSAWYGGWRFLRRAFALASAKTPPADENAKLISLGLRSVGYYIWRDGI
jgi:hypothetical protein